MKYFKLPMLFLLLVSHCGHADSAEQQAKSFFARYMKLESAFDPAIVNTYDDNAIIRNTRFYPTGQTRVMTLTGKQYKALMKATLPLAKARGDKNNYSQVKYKRVGQKVRIDATRYSLLKKYSSPMSFVIAPAPGKKWVIVEEHSQSRP